jgi:hypothetical protein
MEPRMIPLFLVIIFAGLYVIVDEHTSGLANLFASKLW